MPGPGGACSRGVSSLEGLQGGFTRGVYGGVCSWGVPGPGVSTPRGVPAPGGVCSLGGLLQGVCSRPTPKGEIEGDQIQAHTQGEIEGEDPSPYPRGVLRGIRSRPPGRLLLRAVRILLECILVDL